MMRWPPATVPTSAPEDNGLRVGQWSVKCQRCERPHRKSGAFCFSLAIASLAQPNFFYKMNGDEMYFCLHDFSYAEWLAHQLYPDKVCTVMCSARPKGVFGKVGKVM